MRAREEAEVRAREEASICRTRSLTSELSSCGRLGEVSRKCPREAPPLPPPPKTRRLREGRTRGCGHRTAARHVACPAARSYGAGRGMSLGSRCHR